MSQTEVIAELGSRINIIEEAYEFMLAYASQGLVSDKGNDTGRQAREYLKKCDADRYREVIGKLGIRK